MCRDSGISPDEAIAAEGTHRPPPVIRSAGTPWAPRTPYVGTTSLEVHRELLPGPDLLLLFQELI